MFEIYLVSPIPELFGHTLAILSFASTLQNVRERGPTSGQLSMRFEGRNLVASIMADIRQEHTPFCPVSCAPLGPRWCAITLS